MHGRLWWLSVRVCEATAGIASAAYHVAAEARDRRRFPPPGRLADVGGRFLQLLDAGTGSPPVVIVPAIGGNVLNWLAFHRELARHVLVCVYDRAGFGWSDPPPRGRRTFDDIADELRQGLAGAGIGLPYLLVGHSIGGIIARRFAVRYRGDVAGMVLIESSHEDQARRHRADGWWRGAPRTLWYVLRQRARILGLRRLAVQAGFSEMNAEIARDVPPECAAAARAVSLTARHRQAVVRELILIARSHGLPTGLGGLTLTVLTAAGRDATWMQMQAESAGLSTAGTHIVAWRGRAWDAPIRGALQDAYADGRFTRRRSAPGCRAVCLGGRSWSLSPNGRDIAYEDRPILLILNDRGPELTLFGNHGTACPEASCLRPKLGVR